MPPAIVALIRSSVTRERGQDSIALATRSTLSTKFTCYQRSLQRLVEDFGGAARACEVCALHNGPGKNPDHSSLTLPTFRFHGRHQGNQAAIERDLLSKGMTAQPNALQMVARRTAGSMRDSQSLLEQLLSVCVGEITVAGDLNRMLGTAEADRFPGTGGGIAAHDVQQCLTCVDYALRERADVADLPRQLLEYLRDMLAASLGASRDIMLATSPGYLRSIGGLRQATRLRDAAGDVANRRSCLGPDAAKHPPRVLLEIAIVRMCQLEALDELSNVLGQLQSGVIAPASTAQLSHHPPANLSRPMPVSAPVARPTHTSPSASPSPSQAVAAPPKKNGPPNQRD